MFVNILYNIFCIIFVLGEEKRYSQKLHHTWFQGKIWIFGEMYTRYWSQTSSRRIGITEEKLEESIVFQVYIYKHIYVCIHLNIFHLKINWETHPKSAKFKSWGLLISQEE